MRRYTDATFTITATGAHFTTAQEIHVTFKQAETIDFTGDAITVLGDEELTVMLTQDDTKKFTSNPARMEINYIDANGKRKASDIVSVNVLENLLEVVLND